MATMEISGVWNAKTQEGDHLREIVVLDGRGSVFLRVGGGPNIQLTIDQAKTLHRQLRAAIKRSQPTGQE